MPAGHLQTCSGEVLKAAICDQTARICQARYGQSLRAVVLTGSLARDEATFAEEDHCWSLLGDADFFLVFHDRSRLPVLPEVESAAQEINDSLRQNGLIASAGLAAVHGSYFRKLPRHIATFELRSCGRVVWGDPDILSLIPAFEPRQISLEDAWRILANRIIEVIEVAAADDRSGEMRYRTVKLFLDMATSYLVFAGSYLPTYWEREHVLRRMASEVPEQARAPFPLRPFAERVSECTRFKLGGTSAPCTPETLLEDAVHFAHLLWRWELRRLTGGAEESSDSELMSNWMERQPVKARIRGWASVLRACGWHRSRHEWLRWSRLCWRASPRYWVYGVATDAFFRIPTAEMQASTCQNEIFEELTTRLPLLSRAEGAQPAADLRVLMRLTARNYRRLLEATTA